VSTRVSTHAPLHEERPAAHAHVPAAHAAPGAHAIPQPLQLRASVARSTQALAQLTRGAGHADVQVAFAHTCPALQLVEQFPQCAGSFASATQEDPHRT
jgi:hypothetical protein